MLPNFLICGIQRGGTTSLYQYLRAHPDIFMAPVKEINFFNINYQRGRVWYEAHFAANCGERAVGEASPLYMWDPEVPQRIAGLIPTARLIFVLRNPIERAYSNYWFNVSRGGQNPNQSFSEAIRAEDGYRRYITKGFYYEQTVRFLRCFDPTQLYIIISEDLRSKPLDEVRRCFQFLGIDTDYAPNIHLLYNITLVPRNVLSSRLYGLWSPLRERLLPMTPKAIRDVTRDVRTTIHRLLFLPQEQPPMKYEDRHYLEEVYNKQNDLLSDYLGRDLTFWK